MSKKQFMRSTGLVGGGTAISKLLGFVRDVGIAQVFGTAMAAQAFIVAFRIPNMMRALVGEGAANTAVVPVMTEYHATKPAGEYLRLFRALFNTTFTILAALSIGGILLSPVIIRVIAPGFMKDPEKLILTIHLSRIIFPYLLLIGLTAFLMGVLNSKGHFAAPAFGQGLLNVSVLASLFVLCPKIGVYGLAVGVLGGGALQLFVNWLIAHREGLTVSAAAGFSHEGVRKVGRLMLPRIAGAAVYQANLFVDTVLASLGWIVGAGGVAGLYYAHRLIQFPLAIFGNSIAQVALPKMSREAAENDIQALNETLLFSLRFGFFVMIPASAGLAALSTPIIRTLFERGNFGAYSTFITQRALLFYSFGLFASCGIKILVNGFYALQDTVTPVKTAGAAVVLNIVLNLILMWPLKIGGIALATSIAAIVNFCMLFYLLRKKIGGPPLKDILDPLYKIVASAAVMVLFCRLMARWIAIPPGYSTIHNAASLAAIILPSVVVYIAATLCFGMREASTLVRWISRKR
ncbi:MAG: murein biosynthesis integral membrane protein MurJ [Candidatus Omnitrophota bacterium]